MTEKEIDIYRQYMIERMPNAQAASGGKEVNCRCLYHDDHSRHMYINIPNSNDEPLMFYCQKCRSKGFITPDRLSEWNIYDDEIAAIILSHMKKAKTKAKYDYEGSRAILFNTYIKNDDLSNTKLAYINKRLGTNLTFEECKKLKICLNLNDLLISNNIYNKTRNDNIINELDINFVGFISLDNNYVNLRRIVKEGNVYKSIDKRYINYNIFGKFENLERFYTIPTIFNAYQVDRIKMHIAEGPFDILSIYKNVRQEESGIYTSIAGNNYIGTIKHFIMTLRLPYIEIHVYPDNPTEKDDSGDDNHMKYISNFCRPLNIPVYIHRNTYKNEKDFGVPSKHIKEIIYQV